MLVNLLDYVSIISGGTPRTEQPEYWNGNIPWLTIDDFRYVNKYVYKTDKHITQMGLANSSTNILQRNDLIISARGTVGKIALIPVDMAFNQSCFGIRVRNKTKLNPEYLFYYLRCNISSVLRKSQGAIFDSINLESFKHIKIALPEIAQQEKIVELLSKTDEQIELNFEMVNKLQVLGKTIYSRNIEQVKFTKLRLVSSITTGKEDANHAAINGKYKFFTCSNDTLLCDDFKFEGKSVLVAGNGDFNVKFYNGRFNAYQRTYVIKNDAIIGNLFFTLLFNTELFKKKAQGSIIKFITIDMLNKIDVPMFSARVNVLLNKALSKLNVINKSTESLQILKNNILPLLINQQLV